MIKRTQPIDVQIAVCGRGGQGILFLTRLLVEVGVATGSNVISSETHGMAMRGGSVVSHIRIGGYCSPLIRAGQADILLVLSEHELISNDYLLKKKGGQLFINGNGRKRFTVNASMIASQLGSSLSANLVLLGFACGHDCFPLGYDMVKKTLNNISNKSKLDNNIKALYYGYSAACPQHSRE